MGKSTIFFGGMLLALLACDKTPPRPLHHCDPTEGQRVADFVIKCAEAANPNSDEEGEDLVAQCQATGIKLLCPLVETCIYKNGWPEPCNWNRDVKADP